MNANRFSEILRNLPPRFCALVLLAAIGNRVSVKVGGVVILAFVLLTVPAGILVAAGQREPGHQPDGSILLVNNWTITAAGRPTPLGDFPVNATLSPNGRFLLVVNSGASVQSLQVMATATHTVVQTLPYPAPQSVFVGLAYSPDGRRVYTGGGGSEVIHVYNAAPSGRLTPTRDIRLGKARENPFPAGLSLSPNGSILYVADNLTHSVSVVNTSTMKVIRTIQVGAYPYTTLVGHDGKHVYVSNWGSATISVISTASDAVTATIHVGNHPSAMTFGPWPLLFIADSNSDAISVVDTRLNAEVRRIRDTLYPHAPLGTSPEGLAMDPPGTRLYVANAGDNDVAVFALHRRARSATLLGRIPTAWYPTSVTLSQNGAMLFVTNAKGDGTHANSRGHYPDPESAVGPFVDNYIGTMIVGSLSSINVPSSGALHRDTHLVGQDDRVLPHPARRSIPRVASRIRHVIYIIKENRTYDQVFGDESIGNGDRAITLFPRANTPNLHALAERFGLLDNFYADAEVSADGHNWATSADASDYNEKMWPQHYSGRRRGYDFGGESSINLSAGGYLWDAAVAAHLTFRDYGEFVPKKKGHIFIPASQARTCTGPVARSYIGIAIPPHQVLCFVPTRPNPITTPHLVGHVDPRYRTFDLNYREADRVAEWRREFDQYVAHDNLPRFEIMRLPNDHTASTLPNYLTPQAYIAENDWAVGKVAEIVSHSKYWDSTAIFVTEDDAQDGPDHVDAHRTISLVISPYTSREKPRVDHTLYDTAAMIRTMELILGLPPLSQYDAAATPMWRLFDDHADLRPYNTIRETVPVNRINTTASYGATASRRMDFTVEDQASMDAVNRILWHAIKGPRTPYPSVLP